MKSEQILKEFAAAKRAEARARKKVETLRKKVVAIVEAHGGEVAVGHGVLKIVPNVRGWRWPHKVAALLERAKKAQEKAKESGMADPLYRSEVRYYKSRRMADLARKGAK